MNKFENELKVGNFVISQCTTCNQVVWPASDFCNICHNNTIWRNANNIGKITDDVIDKKVERDLHPCLFLNKPFNQRSIQKILKKTIL